MESAYAAAMRLLANREHTAVELSKKLASRGFEHDIVEKTVDRLSVTGMQSDERFVEVYIHSRVTKGYGPAHISRALREKGISTDLAHKHLESSDNYWLTIAKDILARKFSEEITLSAKEWDRRARFLSSRGFSGSIIYKVLPSKNWD